MRVIAGSAKGHRLYAVPGGETRPITDRVKESLFNILGERIVGARVLDLFAGTGAVGIEALSRGAAHAVFVDKSSAALRTVRRNLEHTRLLERATLVQADVFRYLAGPIEQPFHLIYVAPPQYRGWWVRVINLLDERPEWLVPLSTATGLVVVQMHPREYQKMPLSHLSVHDVRRYGSTLLCFYKLGSARTT
ncbi:MAG: 16S rRNA (guanine(966)-N(2))-methyltransferase RsmD [Ardenticatenia bacterium]|jgi:16S rRNA (guanine(966)-N(2))-methyltransferase RsmD|nr:MAG: 16S rRNA (guanine(966)-N(2))-methyltransferase RsmD [Ardenticatenia bacterium]